MTTNNSINVKARLNLTGAAPVPISPSPLITKEWVGGCEWSSVSEIVIIITFLK